MQHFGAGYMSAVLHYLEVVRRCDLDMPGQHTQQLHQPWAYTVVLTAVTPDRQAVVDYHKVFPRCSQAVNRTPSLCISF